LADVLYRLYTFFAASNSADSFPKRSQDKTHPHEVHSISYELLLFAELFNERMSFALAKHVPRLSKHQIRNDIEAKRGEQGFNVNRYPSSTVLIKGFKKSRVVFLKTGFVLVQCWTS
jgi:hypothetical protein